MTTPSPSDSARHVAERLYADRDVLALRQHYVRHVAAMTAEGLHAKSDIAAELAWRDAEIERLTRALRQGGEAWQPMDSVPRVGRFLAHIDGVDRAVLVEWNGAEYRTFDGNDWTGRSMLAWHALPTPPAQTEDTP